MAKILIIDDSASVLAFIENALAKAGHEPRTAGDGLAASRLLEADHFDLVITDIYMPDRDGLETIMALRKSEPNLPIIAMSSNDGCMDVLKVATRFGAVRSLKKPFRIDDLMKVVNEAIGCN